jgi:FkbM family methyltransferase
MLDMHAPLARQGDEDIFAFPYGDKTYKFWFPVKGEALQSVITATGAFYEADLLAYLKQVIGQSPRATPDTVILDIGGNIGNHAIFFAREIGLPVVAFEPVPLTYSILSENIALNGVADRITAHRCGVGARATSATIRLSSMSNLGGTMLEEAAEADPSAMPIVAIDGFIGDLKPCLIKIDVEGMEKDVLTGAIETIRTHMPFLCIESKDIRHYRELIALIGPLGYMPIGILGDVPTIIFAPAVDFAGTAVPIATTLAQGYVAQFAETQRLKSIRKRLERELAELRKGG